jgi:hypothetical protein
LKKQQTKGDFFSMSIIAIIAVANIGNAINNMAVNGIMRLEGDG